MRIDARLSDASGVKRNGSDVKRNGTDVFRNGLACVNTHIAAFECALRRFQNLRQKVEMTCNQPTHEIKISFTYIHLIYYTFFTWPIAVVVIPSSNIYLLSSYGCSASLVIVIVDTSCFLLLML